MLFVRLFLFAFAVFTLQAGAEPTAYDCHAIVIATDLKDGAADVNFRAEVTGAAHGGREYDFSFQNHKLEILSDGKWLAVTWSRDGKTVASATSVRTDAATGSYVLILADPADFDQQVSVTCGAVAAQ